MKRLLLVLCVTMALISCGSEEPSPTPNPNNPSPVAPGDDDPEPMPEPEPEPTPTGSKYILINQLSGNGNISLYDAATEKLTEKLIDFGETSTVNILASAYLDNSLYLQTSYPPTIRAIAVDEKTQNHKTLAWGPTGFLIPYTDGVILCSRPAGFASDDEFLNIKIYNKNLTLLDSLVDVDILQVNAAILLDNKLFCGVLVKNVGPSIHILDLSSKTFLSPIALTTACRQMIKLANTQLLVAENDSYFVTDTQTLTPSPTTAWGFGADAMTFNSADNLLYIVHPNAQPTTIANSLYQYNLSNQQFERISDPNVSISTPILFDANAEVIATGGLSLFGKDGKVLKSISAPSNTSNIFVR
ncbi:MAG: hypothetical protein AB7O48_05940 [Cyclobacteriaceae bacterium]